MEIRDSVTLLFDVWTTARLVKRVLDEGLAASGLDGDDYAFYSMLREAGPVTPRTLAEWSGLAPTTVSSYLKRLEHRGHLTRVRNQADGRSWLVALTEAGDAAHGAATSLFIPLWITVVERLGTEGVTRGRAAMAELDDAVRIAGGLRRNAPA